MPTYEYACKACGEHLEVVQSFTDDALTKCPNCGGQLRKVFGSVGVTFKGSGFYKTDSRKAATAASAKSDSSTDKSTGDKSSSDTSSDSKSETKSADTKTDGKSDAPKADTKSTPSPSKDKAAS